MDHGLSRDARRVLSLSATGLTSDVVAARLGIAPDETRRLIREAITALGARSKIEAVLIALRLGLLDIG